MKKKYSLLTVIVLINILSVIGNILIFKMSNVVENLYLALGSFLALVACWKVYQLDRESQQANENFSKYWEKRSKPVEIKVKKIAMKGKFSKYVIDMFKL